ncbi:MAG: Gfo/Idh/MocA family oxidoreductase [Eubacteriales bacterium]|nr:Gfo/Idh/MocA family oxidoreductase [Eubacteriales bacterium]
MEKKMTLAVIGCGEFAKCFVPLFKAHPMVEKVYVCDKIPEKAQKYREEFDVETIDSLETVLSRKEIDSIAVFVQRHLHGPVVKAALAAGKNVYSAVPMASSVDECREIVKMVEKTGLTYMMGETCVYYPCAMFCKQEYEKGTFGKFVYGESQYYHDISHFPEDFRKDKPSSAVPPFYYPTHSTAMILHATGAHVVKVTGVGYRDTEPDTPYQEGANPWNNPFSNEYSLMQLSDGSVARVNECRRIGYKAPSSCISGFYGTQGSYQFSNAQHLITSLTKQGVRLRDVSDEVNPVPMTAAKGEENFKERVANHEWQWTDPSPVQEAELARLPEAFAGLTSGHMCSHALLVDDFCKAVYRHELPRVNAWQAARFTIPGLVAHESAMRGGELMDVPDMGDAPKSWPPRR